ncbi:hypothetical protein CPS_1975 [Colwellia psychrerythraea 34H]|uniref:Uncharacterized protein n=1 Tax=Colwellia psychrerythraea (strain 34H / ATCC BAA-681) TaxID=167879 RepID=Q483R1_COLP3|nr:hypothetical protein CPS_1975 [Colwellia psychrerythraea 34H]
MSLIIYLNYREYLAPITNKAQDSKKFLIIDICFNYRLNIETN